MFKNKTLLGVLAVLSAGAIWVIAATVVPEDRELIPSVTTVAATATNTANGTILTLQEGMGSVRFYLTASGIASTTNGNLLVDIATASGNTGRTNNFETIPGNQITVTTSSNDIGAGTNTYMSAIVNLSGVRYLRIGRIRNTYQGPVSNLVMKVGGVRGGGTP